MGGFDAVDERYSALYERAVEAAAADQRIVRVDVHGSIATQTADKWSDLDLKVIVREADLASVVGESASFIDAISPTVLADSPLAPFIVNAVTTDGLTLDVSFWADNAPEWPLPTGLQVGFLSGRRYDNYPDAVTYAVNESLRGLAGPLIKFLQRGQHITHFMGLGHTLSLLITVLLAEADAPIDGRRPADALNKEQRWLIANLPAAQPTFQSLLAYEFAIAKEVLTRSRALLASYGRAWPSAFEAVAAKNLREQLGVAVDFVSE